MKDEPINPVPAALPWINAATLATLVPVVLHQLSVLGHLPDPPSALFDSDRITESDAAHPMGIPDGLLGLGSFSLTLALALAARSYPAARKLLAAKVVADTAAGGFNAIRQVVSLRKLCSWCTGTALGAFAAAAVSAPLIREEWRDLRNKRLCSVETLTNLCVRETLG